MSDTFDWRDPVSHWITSKSDQPFDTVASVPSDSLAISIMGDAQDFRDIGKLSKLQQINVFGLSQKNSSFLAEIPALQRLYIRGGGVKDLEFLKKLVNLDSLYLWQTVRLVSLRGLESATNLLSLTLFEATSNSRQLDLSPLASLPRLQYLELRGPMKVQSLTPLKEARSLKRIYVYVNVVDASIEPLLSLPALERIDMWKLDKTFSLDTVSNATSFNNSNSSTSSGISLR